MSAARSTTVAVDHPAFAGHFPGRPLLPGVLLVAEAMEAVAGDAEHAAFVGPAPRLSVVKFLAPVRPGDVLDVQLRRVGAALAFEVRSGERLCASGQFAAAASGAMHDEVKT